MHAGTWVACLRCAWACPRLTVTRTRCRGLVTPADLLPATGHRLEEEPPAPSHSAMRYPASEFSLGNLT